MILDRSLDGVSWLPWQYYSKDCQVSYDMTGDSSIGEDSQSIICSQQYSDILPYTGGTVEFDVISR